MLALISSFLFLLSAAPAATGEASKGVWSSIREFWAHYFNYPGFELWKFLNLAIFVGFLVYVAGKPLSSAFKAKREAIREELIKAEAEKKAALDQLTSVEAKLVGAESEKASVMTHAREEIEAEKARLAEQAMSEAQKLKAQADGEITRLGAVAQLGLRRFSVDESLRLAEEKLRAQVDAKTDANLIKSGIQAIGGLN